MLYLDNALADPDEITFGFSPTYGDVIGWEKEDDTIGLRGGVRIRVGESINEMVTASDVGYFFENAIA
jgi:hypothetical protein